jgi:hypothetical protein
MISNWQKFNEGLKIKSKISLLEDLSLELSDLGLKVDIWNGTWRDNGGSFGGVDYDNYRNIGTDTPSKSIIMLIEDIESVLDVDNYYENELKDKQEILDFEETLKSYGMTPTIKTGFSDKVYLFFNKQSRGKEDILKYYNKND